MHGFIAATTKESMHTVGAKILKKSFSGDKWWSPFPRAKAAEADSAVQIDLGEQDVTVSITVRWALN